MEYKELEGHNSVEGMHDSNETSKKACEQEKDSNNDSSSGSLDFFSPEFDPLKALHAKDLVPPNPRVRPLDNLSACRRILPKEVPESVINAPPKVARSAESILAQERAKAHKSNLLQKAAERERQVKILDKIAERAKHGPVGLLAECYEHKLRVKVWTRHTHGVRGTLIGFLVAFDKHLNMVLRDIEEEYSVRRWIPRLVRCRGRSACSHSLKKSDDAHDQQSIDALVDPSIDVRNNESMDHEADIENGIEKLTSQLKELKSFPKLEHRRRHLKQVFLRGDSVVIIQKLV